MRISDWSSDVCYSDLGVATRTLGAADFGRFALITGASQAIALLVGFQTWQIVVRYGVDHLNSGDDVGLAALLRACVGLDVLSAVVGIGLAILKIGRASCRERVCQSV